MEIEADSENPSQINRYHVDGVHKTNITEWNKKRKLQTDQLDLLTPKHKCWVGSFSSERDSMFDKNPELESIQKFMVKGRADASVLDDRSGPESAKDSNSFSEDSDTAMSINEVAKLEIDCAKTYLYGKTSSCEGEHKLSYHDTDIQALKNLQEHLLALGNCTDHMYSEYTKDSIEHSIDKEFEDVLYSNEANTNMYVLSSGRWNVNQGMQHYGKLNIYEDQKVNTEFSVNNSLVDVY